MAAPFSKFTKSPNSPFRFQPVEQSERLRLGQNGQDVQRFREQRQKLETAAAASSAVPGSKDLAPARVPFPGSPFVSKPVTELGQGLGPPQSYEAPQPDPRVEPKSRVARWSNQPQQRTVNRLPLDTAQPKPKVGQPATQPQPQPRTERPAPNRNRSLGPDDRRPTGTTASGRTTGAPTAAPTSGRTTGAPTRTSARGRTRSPSNASGPTSGGIEPGTTKKRAMTNSCRTRFRQFLESGGPQVACR